MIEKETAAKQNHETIWRFIDLFYSFVIEIYVEKMKHGKQLTAAKFHMNLHLLSVQNTILRRD